MPAGIASLRGDDGSIESVTLSPEEVCDLLGLPRDDAPVLSSAPIRLPARWAAQWVTKIGPLELLLTEASHVTGIPRSTLMAWQRDGTLVCRRAARCQHRWKVSPAALVAAIRRVAAGPAAPNVSPDSPAKQRRDGEAAKARAIKACGGQPC